MGKTSKKQLNVNRDQPYKVVASGFPVMRFSDSESAMAALRGFRGPGACLVVCTSGAKSRFMGYKYMKR